MERGPDELVVSALALLSIGLLSLVLPASAASAAGAGGAVTSRASSANPGVAGSSAGLGGSAGRLSEFPALSPTASATGPPLASARMLSSSTPASGGSGVL